MIRIRKKIFSALLTGIVVFSSFGLVKAEENNSLSIYVDMLSKAIAYKAVGDDENAKTAAKECFDKMSELEVYIEHWYDQHMIYYALKRVFGLE